LNLKDKISRIETRRENGLIFYKFRPPRFQFDRFDWKEYEPLMIPAGRRDARAIKAFEK
jgi:hypothetical protein